MTLNGRPVCDIEIDHARDPVDSCILKAYWEDTGEPLTDAELDKLQEEQAEYIQDAWFQHQIGRAEQ